jgi:hypothetical protein
MGVTSRKSGHAVRVEPGKGVEKAVAGRNVEALRNLKLTLIIYFKWTSISVIWHSCLSIHLWDIHKSRLHHTELCSEILILLQECLEAQISVPCVSFECPEHTSTDLGSLRFIQHRHRHYINRHIPRPYGLLNRTDSIPVPLILYRPKPSHLQVVLHFNYLSFHI